MRALDLSILLAGTLITFTIWFEGYHQAAQAEERGGPGFVGTILSPGGAEGGSASAMLPTGMRIDPTTGLLLGVTPPDIPGTKPVTWELLRTYEYRPGLEGLPQEIRALDGERIVMIGFLMTLFEFDDIHEFFLVASHWACCYGVPPTLESAVHVKLARDEEGLPNTIKPLRVIGTLRVKEVKDSEIVTAIYSIEDAEVLILDY
jgi:hypothetical protein